MSCPKGRQESVQRLNTSFFRDEIPMSRSALTAISRALSSMRNAGRDDGQRVSKLRRARQVRTVHLVCFRPFRPLGLPQNASLCGLKAGRVFENMGIGPLQCEVVTPGYEGSDHDDTTTQKMIRRESPLAPFLQTAFKFIAATWQPPGSGDRQVSYGD
jgi:hypothetical protein